MADDAQRSTSSEDDRRQRLARVRRRLNFDNEPVSPPHPRMDSLEDAAVILNLVTSQSKDASARWNFDFTNEVPLEGVWEWEKIECRNQQDYKDLTIERENKNGQENRTI